MTDEMMTLRMLLDKERRRRSVARDDRLHRPRLMELEVESKAGAGYGEKSVGRLVWRNGYRDRLWETRAGTVKCASPAAPSRCLPGASTSPCMCAEAAMTSTPPSSITCRLAIGVTPTGHRSHPQERVPKLFADPALARGDGRYARLLRALGGVQLLILDDWGLELLDAAGPS